MAKDSRQRGPGEVDTLGFGLRENGTEQPRTRQSCLNALANTNGSARGISE